MSDIANSMSDIANPISDITNPISEFTTNTHFASPLFSEYVKHVKTMRTISRWCIQ